MCGCGVGYEVCKVDGRRGEGGLIRDRKIALCQSALAETIHMWGRIDVILNCDSISTFSAAVVCWELC